MPDAEEAADFARRSASAALHGPRKIFFESLDADGIVRRLVGAPVWAALTGRQQDLLATTVREHFASALAPRRPDPRPRWHGPSFRRRRRPRPCRSISACATGDASSRRAGPSDAGHAAGRSKTLSSSTRGSRSPMRSAVSSGRSRCGGATPRGRPAPGPGRGWGASRPSPSSCFSSPGACPRAGAASSGSRPFPPFSSRSTVRWPSDEHSRSRSRSASRRPRPGAGSRTPPSRPSAWPTPARHGPPGTSAIEAGAPRAPVEYQMGLSARSVGELAVARADFERALAESPPAPGGGQGARDDGSGRRAQRRCPDAPHTVPA